MPILRFAFPLAGCALYLVGCASSGLSARNYSVHSTTIKDRNVLLDAAQTALIAEGYRIDRVDLRNGLVSTEPIETVLQRHERLSSRTRSRRHAQVRVEPGPEFLNIYCKVALQEQMTEAHRMFESQQNRLDTPGQTPIDRDAATTNEQNTVWRTTGRDKVAERRILDIIRASIHHLSPSVPMGAP